ncbi:MAG: hemerythrin domain-containing protein [Sulfurovum sp.]|nr:hemerythrin domain-containing protein [Sulfurovum sp.]
MLNKLLKRFNSKQEQQQSNATYNTDLIPTLKDAHGSLFEIYLEIESVFNQDNEKWHTIMDLVKDFENALKLHVMLEDKQLYTYLENLYETTNNLEHLDHIRELQSNMGDILKEVNYFARKYSDWENYKKNKESFLADLHTIGKVLTKRVKLEETFIYPMYMESKH